jgi:methylenetetrahydrofolate--tRNA-(uracil-5-)-methyltransferase
MTRVTVIGGGLAGCEAAWQLARRGVAVTLVERKPVEMSPAHSTPLLAEIVCSNSLKSDDAESPAGLLKQELRRAGSLILECADETRVPAGEALAVDRHAFARLVTTRIALERGIRLERHTIDEFPEGPVIVATGPLTGDALARRLSRTLGEALYFYDAIAPIVDAETIDFGRTFRASRYGKGQGEYLNCPLSHDEYQALVAELRAARQVVPHAFEEERYFEGCLPIEVMAARGPDTLRYGPMRPVGLRGAGESPWAVVQLRPEDREGTAYNLVGFQTRLAYPEQKRILRIIPALHRAEFLRLGSIHRNTYVDSPRRLGPELELRALPDVRLAGLLVGVEGYVECAAMGLLCALFLAGRLRDAPIAPPPPTTALGALHHHVTRMRGEGEAFQPANIHFGMLPPVRDRAGRDERRRLQLERARRDLGPWLERIALLLRSEAGAPG